MRGKERLMFAMVFLVGILLVPGVLANAEERSYKDIELVKSPSDIVAGSTQSLLVSFKDPSNRMHPFVAELEIEDLGESNVTPGNFEVRGLLKSRSSRGPSENLEDLYCVEVEPGRFYCYCRNFKSPKDFGDSNISSAEIWEVEQPILSNSKNNLTMLIRSHPALLPSNYSFNVSLYKKWEIPGVTKSIEKKVGGESVLFDAGESDTRVWVSSSKNKTIRMNVILCSFTVQDSYPPGGRIHIKSVEINFEDDSSVENAEIRIYYDDLPEDVEESSLRLYHYNESKVYETGSFYSWGLVEGSGVNVEEDYVYGSVSDFSLFGVFGQTVGGGGGTISECGNDECEYFENYCSCPEDCEPELECDGVCEEVECENGEEVCGLVEGCCGNGVCEYNENCGTCSEDCGECGGGREEEAEETTTTIQPGLVGSFIQSPTGEFLTSPMGSNLIVLFVLLLGLWTLRKRF